jgi:hypothetical protein
MFSIKINQQLLTTTPLLLLKYSWKLIYFVFSVCDAEGLKGKKKIQ